MDKTLEEIRAAEEQANNKLTEAEEKVITITEKAKKEANEFFDKKKADVDKKKKDELDKKSKSLATSYKPSLTKTPFLLAAAIAFLSISIP